MAYKVHKKEDREYWEKINAEATKRKSDGCTAVPDLHLECCYQHDIEWGGKTVDGEPISRAECNERFRKCIQDRSKLGRFSPMAWWRWVGVWIGTGVEKIVK